MGEQPVYSIYSTCHLSLLLDKNTSDQVLRFHQYTASCLQWVLSDEQMLKKGPASDFQLLLPVWIISKKSLEVKTSHFSNIVSLKISWSCLNVERTCNEWRPTNFQKIHSQCRIVELYSKIWMTITGTAANLLLKLRNVMYKLKCWLWTATQSHYSGKTSKIDWCMCASLIHTPRITHQMFPIYL